MTATHPSRDAELERWLTNHDLVWTFEPEFALSKINKEASLEAQTRSESISQETIDRYAADYEAGDQFPAFPITKRGRKNVAVGGYHRLAASTKAKRATHPVYVIDGITDEQAHLLALEDNRRHGIPLTDKERARHALALVYEHRYTIGDAARTVGISIHKLQKFVSARRGDDRASNLEISTWPILSLTARSQLNSLTDDVTFAKAVRLCASRAVPAASVTDFVSRLNRMNPREAEQYLAAVEHDARQRVFRQGGRPPSAQRAPALRLLGDLDLILRFDPETVAAGLPEDVRDRLHRQLVTAARRCMEIDKEITK